MLGVAAAAVLWLLSPVLSERHYTAECTDPGPLSVTVALSDSPPGRVVVRYCSPADALVSRWDLVLYMLPDVPRAACSYERLGERRVGTLHSYSEERVQLHLNCTDVCFSRTLDLVYRGCYRLQNKLVRGLRSSEAENSYYYSSSKALDSDYYTNNSQLYKDFDNEKEVVLRWYQGAIPIEEFNVELQRTDTDRDQDALDVTSNCTRMPDSTSVRCALSIAPGCYVAHLTHRATWASSALLRPIATTHATFCHEGLPGALTTTSSPMGAVTWWLVGLLVVSLGAGGAVLWRARTRTWLEAIKPRIPVHSTTPSTELPPLVTSSPPTRILLLYARECAAGARVAHCLRDLLQTVAKHEVYDLYSAETVSLAAAAPGEWVRDMMTSPHTRVLLLQTPALACMYRVTAPHSHLCSPLLGSGAVYAAPMFGDSLLALCVRLLTEGPPQPMPYLTYYLATLEALPTEALPHVVPYRRYELPTATRRLLDDLASSYSLVIDDHHHQLHHKLAAFTKAVDELVEYVRNNENYLAEELMFL